MHLDRLFLFFASSCLLVSRFVRRPSSPRLFVASLSVFSLSRVQLRRFFTLLHNISALLPSSQPIRPLHSTLRNQSTRPPRPHLSPPDLHNVRLPAFAAPPSPSSLLRPLPLVLARSCEVRRVKCSVFSKRHQFTQNIQLVHDAFETIIPDVSSSRSTLLASAARARARWAAHMHAIEPETCVGSGSLGH